MRAPRLHNQSPKDPRNGKIEKVTNTKSPKSRKDANPKNEKTLKWKCLYFIHLGTKKITPKRIEKC